MESTNNLSIEDLAPDITRQRLLIEGYYTRNISAENVKRFLLGLAAHLNLRTYGGPIVHAPGGEGKAENEGFDAFLPLIDSGISLYVWTAKRFFACVLFTCKAFDNEAALAYTSSHLQCEKTVYKIF